MRFSDFAFARKRSAIDSDQFVAHVHEAVEKIIDVTLDSALKFSDRLPWTAEEITSQVEAFVSKHVPSAERCAESAWDDKA